MILSISTTNHSLYLAVPYFAQTYNDSQYAESVYGSSEYGTTQYGGDPVSNNGPLGGLVDTGTALLFTITVGSVLVFGAILARVLRRSNNKSSTQE